jgi:hypothetical protein
MVYLETAVKAGSYRCTELLCQLPAAAELGPAAVAQLLPHAKAQGFGGCAQQLRSLIDRQQQT